MRQLNIKNLAELYRYAAEKYGDRPSFLTKQDSSYSGPTFQELYEMGLNLATGLIDIGLKAKEHVVLLADNCLEWMISDYGIILCGAADVPRGTDVTEFDMTYIVPHSDARIVFVEHQEMLDKLLKIRGKLPKVEHFVMMKKEFRPAGGVLHLYDLIEKGKQLRAAGDRRVEERIAEVKPDDLFTMIYTSGTTGAPKGVMLTHSNITSQILRLPLPLNEQDRALSILPIWHIYERMAEIVSISIGLATYYTNVRHVREDMGIVTPTFMASAPRLWENVYQAIKQRVDSGPAVKRALFNAANFCATVYNDSKHFLTFKKLDVAGRNPLLSLAMVPLHLLRLLLFYLPYRLLDALVFSKIRAVTGGKLRATMSGGSALPLHVDKFFNNMGLRVLEGYGLTETSPALSTRTMEKAIMGTVGPIWPDTELRLIDIQSGKVIYPAPDGRGKKGEIHVKGPQVMKGYYKNPEATNAVLKDGWFNTGDLGIITYNNCLKIVGRSKETIVLLGGENVEPVPIENKLLESPLIDQCMLVGQDKKYMGCLVVPNLEALSNYGENYAALADNPQALNTIKQEIKSLISSENGFKSFERVVNCRLLPKPFEVGDELTNIFKTKRHVVTEKYQDLIESMYQ